MNKLYFGKPKITYLAVNFQTSQGCLNYILKGVIHTKIQLLC